MRCRELGPVRRGLWVTMAMLVSRQVSLEGGSQVSVKDGSKVLQTLAPAPEIYELQHSVVHYNKKWYCAHPRQGLFGYFGDGEIVVGHNHAPCGYEADSEAGRSLAQWGVWHGRLNGYYNRAVVLLQRSPDGGKTWPKENDAVVYDETMPLNSKRAFLYQKGVPREPYDMFRPDSMFFFGVTYLPDERGDVPECFSLRSPDRGRTWEKVPTIIKHPVSAKRLVLKYSEPAIRMADGKTLLAAMVDAEPGGGPLIYASTDQGATWDFVRQVAMDRSGRGRFTYQSLLLTPRGDLHCYYLHISSENEIVEGLKNAICMSVSKDRGKTWSETVPISGKGTACWKNQSGRGMNYRSPWPILLRDGRILVIFARRRMPMGIGGILSADGGKTWSPEFVIRDDASNTGDLGYPVGTQLDDGRIFIAYYYTLADGNNFGGTRFIASSSFRIRGRASQH